MMRFLASAAFWQVAACVTGVVVCAVPCDVIHRGFWDYHSEVSRSDTRGIRIEQIQPNTPAAALEEKDRLVAINGREDAVYDIHKAWREAPVGSEVEFRVLRGDGPLFGTDRRIGRGRGQFEFEAGFGGQRFRGSVRPGEELLMPDPERVGPDEATAARLAVAEVGRGGESISWHFAEPPIGFCGMIPQNPSFGGRVRRVPE